MATDRFIVEVEKGKEGVDGGSPSVGSVYRSIYAKDGFPEPADDLLSCWDIFRLSAEKSPDNPMLGRREIVDGKAGKYVWQTYKEVYDIVIKLGNSIRTIGVGKGEKCGIYGANSPEWIISMEACNAHGLYCVPLYDTLGAGAIEFIICHAKVSLAFSEEKKISELLKTAPNSTKYLKNIVSFGEVSNVQRAEAERHGLSIYSWDQFLKLGEGKHYELPEKKRSDICTIMYTSGTTGDPKGVLLTNESIIYLLEGVKKLLKTINEELTSKDVYLSYLPLAHIFDRVIEELFIYEAASIGFWRGVDIVSFGEVSNVQRAEAERHGLSIYSWDQFLKLGEGKHYELPEKKRSDICTIMYTSGTTGDPKGVLLTNESIIYLLEGVKKLLKTINEELTSKDVYLSYLPLAHIFDRVIEELFIYEAASIGFWRGDVKILVEDIAALKPTIFCAVPRVLERIYNGLQQKLSDGGFLKKTLFNFAFNYKHNNMVKGKAHEQAAPIFDKIVFKKVKEGLGGRVRLILSGAAPLAAHIESFLRVVACAHVLQGYGLTESCGGTFVSIPNELQMLGTVGPPVPNVDIRLESVPEMGYDALASKPRGEICIRGKTLFSGYYKREDLTQEVFIDGWLHTGDVGEWQPDGAMKIIDRKKNIFKLSQGEYVAVENLENIYSHVAAIESVWVYGNSYESYLVAVVCPSKIQIEHWAKEHNVSGDFETIGQNQKTKEFILGEFNRVAKDKKLKGFELIKGVHLDTVPFDMERDLITPSYKKKRPQLLKYYQKEIDEMYNKTKN
ncbi:BnaC09g11030D [Brassica napus]|uniref:Long-chain-fatty-acid--CoA ligase n=1 Tax=Brassica napus TaxID=3708 RepID=A0A078I6L7_BRANA|nr:BnaC09g11030D [Brassica napus]